MKPVYIDVDGVLADFDDYVLHLYGSSGGFQDPMNQARFWKEDCVTLKAFLDFRKIPEGFLLVHSLVQAGVPICFLTSTGGLPHHGSIAIQKMLWLFQNGLGMHPVAFVMNTESKGSFASIGRILIDDRQKVLDEWNKQGGLGYLFERNKAVDIAEHIIALNKYQMECKGF